MCKNEEKVHNYSGSYHSTLLMRYHTVQYITMCPIANNPSYATFLLCIERTSYEYHFIHHPGQFSFLTNFLLVDVVALRYFADRRYTLYTVLPFQIFKLVLFYCCTVSYGTKYAFSTESEIYSHILILSTLSYNV